MPIAKNVVEALEGASWIRRMFEEGLKLKARYGEDAVADVSLGNPVMEPPGEVYDRLRALLSEPPSGAHRYMPNAGLSPTRQAVAAHLEKHTGVPYRESHVLMTVGAGGAAVALMRTILDPGDEVIILAPFFVEYIHYIKSFSGKPVVVETDDVFRPDAEAVARAITPRTRAVFVNSPNNPTGVVYPAEDFEALGRVLEEASERHGRPIYLISDEPYRALAYDGVDVPWPVLQYRDTIHVTSFSKDLALPGERIGYLALNPDSEHSAPLFGALVYSMRALGFVNAPALQQRMVGALLDVTVDMAGYADKRRRLLDALSSAGYEVVRPDGAFYVFPKVPTDEDDVAFVKRCLEQKLLVVPGSGFGRPGHFRISYAVTDHTVDLAVEALARVVP